MQFRNWYCSDGNHGLSSSPIAVAKGSRKGGDWAASRVTVFDRRGHCVNRSFLNCSRRRIKPRTLFVLTPLVRSHSEFRIVLRKAISLCLPHERLFKAEWAEDINCLIIEQGHYGLFIAFCLIAWKAMQETEVSTAMPSIVCEWSLDQHQNLLVTDSFQSIHFYCTVYNLTVCTFTIYTFIGHTFIILFIGYTFTVYIFTVFTFAV